MLATTLLILLMAFFLFGMSLVVIVREGKPIPNMQREDKHDDLAETYSPDAARRRTIFDDFG